MKNKFTWLRPSSRQAVICMAILRIKHGMGEDEAICLSLSRNSRNPERISKRELSKLRNEISESMKKFWPASG